MVKGDTESLIDYILRGETAANALKNTGETVSDGLLVAMILKGLPDDFKAFIAIITQSDAAQNFQKFKQALRNFEETEKTRCSSKNESSENSVMKTKVDYNRNRTPITCYNCGISGHKSLDCRKPKENKWWSECRSSTHTDRTCRKPKDTVNKADDELKHSFAFKASDEDDYPSETDTLMTVEQQHILSTRMKTSFMLTHPLNLRNTSSNWQMAQDLIILQRKEELFQLLCVPVMEELCKLLWITSYVYQPTHKAFSQYRLPQGKVPK